MEGKVYFQTILPPSPLRASMFSYNKSWSFFMTHLFSLQFLRIGNHHSSYKVVEKKVIWLAHCGGFVLVFSFFYSFSSRRKEELLFGQILIPTICSQREQSIWPCIHGRWRARTGSHSWCLCECTRGQGISPAIADQFLLLWYLNKQIKVGDSQFTA